MSRRSWRRSGFGPRGPWRAGFRHSSPSGAVGLGGTDHKEAAVLALGVPDVSRGRGRVHSDQTRRVFAEAVAAGSGYESASKEAGIPFSTGWAWYQKYRSGGLLALANVKTSTTYSPALRPAAARAVVDDAQTRAQVMARFKVRGHSALQNWVKQYRNGGSDAFVDVPTVKSAERGGAAPRRGRAASDNLALSEVIAQLDAALPTSMKVQIVASLADRYPVRPLLRALRLPASTYYYRRSRSPKLDRYEEVRPLLRQQFTTAYGAYGYRRLRMRLRRQHGLAISGKTARRLTHEEGYICVVRRRKRRSAGTARVPANVFAPNVLQRDFTTDAPGQKWVTDVTQFSIAGEQLFQSPLIDLFNGEVISHQINTNRNMPMVLTKLQDAPLLPGPASRSCTPTADGSTSTPGSGRYCAPTASPRRYPSRATATTTPAPRISSLTSSKNSCAGGPSPASATSPHSSLPGSTGSTPRASALAETG